MTNRYSRSSSEERRVPIELQNTLNIRPKDLALRLYKLSKQNFINYELRNGNVELMLTEQGFLKAKTPASQPIQPQVAVPQGMAAPASGMKSDSQAGIAPPAGGVPASPQAASQGMSGAPGQPAMDPLAIVKADKAKRKMTRSVEIAIVAIAAIILILLILRYAGVIEII